MTNYTLKKFLLPKSDEKHKVNLMGKRIKYKKQIKQTKASNFQVEWEVMEV